MEPKVTRDVVTLGLSQAIRLIWPTSNPKLISLEWTSLRRTSLEFAFLMLILLYGSHETSVKRLHPWPSPQTVSLIRVEDTRHPYNIRIITCFCTNFIPLLVKGLWASDRLRQSLSVYHSIMLLAFVELDCQNSGRFNARCFVNVPRDFQRDRYALAHG